MDLRKFQNSPAGRVVRARESYWAFVPHPLPPDIPYTPGLVRLLSEADQSLGRLVGVSQVLPNPYLLIQPYIHQEAVLSSRIEGTQTTLPELYQFEANVPVERRADDVREV